MVENLPFLSPPNGNLECKEYNPYYYFSIERATEVLTEALHPFADGCVPLVDGEALSDEVRRYQDTILNKFPAVDDTKFDEVNNCLCAFGLSSGVWDKHPGKLSSVANWHDDQRLHFVVVGAFLDVAKGGG